VGEGKPGREQAAVPAQEHEQGLRWLGQVHHDLVKRLLWPARDRLDAGGQVVPGELEVVLIDDEGAPVEVLALWRRLAEEAPAVLSGAEKDSFAHELGRCREAAKRGDLAGVLQLAPAFEHLAQLVKGASSR